MDLTYREKREEMNVSQTEIAEAIGCTRQMIWKIENRPMRAPKRGLPDISRQMYMEYIDERWETR